MEAHPSSGQQPLSGVTVGGEKYCKCSDSWTCTITPTEPSKAGKPFANCGASCTCITNATPIELSNLQQTLESSNNEGKVICKCGEGWSCVITKAEAAAGTTFFECGEGCLCVIDETNTVKVVACA